MAALVLLLLTGGCGHIGEYTWVDKYSEPPTSATKAYVIGPGDVISVRVWNQEGMSARGRVRDDGKISMPFLNDVEVAGFEPAVLAQRIQTRLKEYIVSPVVTVSLEEQSPFEVSIVGEVTKPGVYRMENGSGVLKAIATAGGLTQIAGVTASSYCGTATPAAKVTHRFGSVSRIVR